MSKLVIVFCAVTFLASVVVGFIPLPIPTENAITRRMDEVLEDITRVSVETYKKVLNVGPKNLEGKFSLNSQYKEALKTHLQVVSFHIDQIISSGRKGNFDEKKCRRPFNKYKVSGKDVLKRIQAMSAEELRNVSFKYGRLLYITKDTRKKINYAKAKGLQSTLDPQDYYRSTAQEDYNYFTTNTRDFLELLRELAVGTNITAKMREIWEQYVNKGQEVMEKTYICVFYPI